MLSTVAANLEIRFGHKKPAEIWRKKDRVLVIEIDPGQRLYK